MPPASGGFDLTATTSALRSRIKGLSSRLYSVECRHACHRHGWWFSACYRSTATAACRQIYTRGVTTAGTGATILSVLLVRTEVLDGAGVAKEPSMGRARHDRLSRPPWDRMMRIHEWIKSGRLPNCVGMAKDLGVSLRTVKRDVEFMADRLSLPIAYDSRRYGFCYTRPVDRFPALPITEAEVFAMLIAHKAIAQYQGTPFQKPLAMAFRNADSIGSRLNCWFCCKTPHFRGTARNAPHQNTLPHVTGSPITDFVSLKIFPDLALGVLQQNQLLTIVCRFSCRILSKKGSVPVIGNCHHLSSPEAAAVGDQARAPHGQTPGNPATPRETPGLPDTTHASPTGTPSPPPHCVAAPSYPRTAADHHPPGRSPPGGPPESRRGRSLPDTQPSTCVASPKASPTPH
jgi:hypothetical protein